MTPRALCLDIGGSFIRLAEAYGAGEIRLTQSLPTPVDDWSAFVAALRQLCAGQGYQGLPLAISTAGLFDAKTGQVTAANIPCFAGHDLPQELGAALDRPVMIANDADSFALAEAALGAGRGHEVVMALILGTGVGGGLVVGGRLARGAGGVTGEWGHGAILRESVVLPSGEILHIPRFSCGCGQSGCTDTIGGARGLERLHLHLSGQEATSHSILDGWEAGVPAALRTVGAYLELLAEPLAFAINITGAHIMPVGGGLGARKALIDALDQAVRGRTLYQPEGALITQGSAVKDGGLLGISVLAMHYLEEKTHAA